MTRGDTPQETTNSSPRVRPQSSLRRVPWIRVSTGEEASLNILLCAPYSTFQKLLLTFAQSLGDKLPSAIIRLHNDAPSDTARLNDPPPLALALQHEGVASPPYSYLMRIRVHSILQHPSKIQASLHRPYQKHERQYARDPRPLLPLGHTSVTAPLVGTAHTHGRPYTYTDHTLVDIPYSGGSIKRPHRENLSIYNNPNETDTKIRTGADGSTAHLLCV